MLKSLQTAQVEGVHAYVDCSYDLRYGNSSF